MGYAMNKKGRKCMAHGSEGCEMCMADGGMIKGEKSGGYEPMPMEDTGEEGIVDRIMKRFAKGGEATMGNDPTPMADGESADFDYLDQMPKDHDADYTGANSGDEMGNEEQDDERDMATRIMKKRAKPKMPHPA